MEKLVSRNFVTFVKIYLAAFTEKFRISEPLRCERSAASIFKKWKTLDYI